MTEDDVKAFRKAQSSELSDELLDRVSGGVRIDCLGCSCSISC